MILRRILTLGLAALALTPVPVVRAAEPAPKAAPALKKALTAEQVAALKFLSDDIARLDALLETIADPAERAVVKSILDGVKNRAHALRDEFDQAVFDELRLAVLVEHQRLLLWLAPLKTPPLKKAPAAKP
jgi:hypothetical protein